MAYPWSVVGYLLVLLDSSPLLLAMQQTSSTVML
jgi:hypothetical protein